MSELFDILIVEDEPVIVNATGKVLRREGYRIDEAFGAESALSKLQLNSFKLVLSDLMLPRISGIDLIEKVKLINPKIPIIIMTGYAMYDNALNCFKAGAFDFIPKPFDIDELLGVVYRAMRHIEQTSGVSSAELHQQNDDQGIHYFLGRHSWAKIERDGIAILGVGETVAAKMGEIQSIELPETNTFIWQANSCAKITAHQHLIHTVWAPLSGEVIEINHELGNDPNLINRAPFSHGWLIKIIPTNLANELGSLVQV